MTRAFLATFASAIARVAVAADAPAQFRDEPLPIHDPLNHACIPPDSDRFAGDLFLRLVGNAGLRCSAQARTGSVTLILRYGEALTLNVHFHMLFLDGVYDVRMPGRPQFVPAPAHPCNRGIRASMHVIACIQDPGVIRRILDRLERKIGAASGLSPQAPRAPPALLGADNAFDPDGRS